MLYPSGQTLGGHRGLTPVATDTYFPHPGDLAALAAEDGVWTADCQTAPGGCGPITRSSYLQFPTPTYRCADPQLASVTVEYLYRVEWKAADSNEYFDVIGPGGAMHVESWTSTGTVFTQGPTTGSYVLSPAPTRTQLAALQWEMYNDGEIQFDYIRLKVDDGCPPVAAPSAVPATGWEWLLGATLALSGAAFWRRRKAACSA